MQKGDNVLLFMQNSPQYIISMFAVLRIRAVVVPINPMSTTSDLEFFVNDGDVKHALIGQELYEKAAPLVENKTLEHTIIAAYSDYANADKVLDTLPEEVAAAPHSFPGTILWSTVMETNDKHYAYSVKIDIMDRFTSTYGASSVHI